MSLAARSLKRITVLTVLILPAGCGEDLPDLAPVTGTVTLDGKPISGAVVTFDPAAGGVVSHGVTDDSGRFELECTTDTLGAELGEHVVRISYRGEDPLLAMPEVLPARYNTQSKLTAAVTEGEENDFKFELTSRSSPEDKQAGFPGMPGMPGGMPFPRQ